MLKQFGSLNCEIPFPRLFQYRIKFFLQTCPHLRPTELELHGDALIERNELGEIEFAGGVDVAFLQNLPNYILEVCVEIAFAECFCQAPDASKQLQVHGNICRASACMVLHAMTGQQHIQRKRNHP